MSEPEKAGPSLWRAMNYGMRQCARYITVHDETGTSIFGPEPELLYKERVGYALAQTYALSKVPAPLTGDEDLTSYLSADGDKNITSYTHAGKQLTIANGVNMVCVDMGPGSSSAMHRTVSVDFVIVTEGEIELELDSGEKKILYSGVRPSYLKDSLESGGICHGCSVG